MNRGPDTDLRQIVNLATESYVLLPGLSGRVRWLFDRLNLDSGLSACEVGQHITGATFWQRRGPSSTACEDGGS